MSDDEYIETEVTDSEKIKQYLEAIEGKAVEMLLSSGGKTVGAILTAGQYEWFLDQLDSQQDIGSIAERVNDKAGS